MIPTDSKIGQGMRIEKLLNECGKNELIPVYLENDTPNFYQNREVKSDETHSVSDAEQCFQKESQTIGKRVWQSSALVSPISTEKAYQTKLKSRISTRAKEKLPCPGKLDADISSWSYDVEGHAKKSVPRYCELANRTTQQLYKVTTPCLGYHQFKEEELGSVGELSKVCSQMVLKMLILGTYW